MKKVVMRILVDLNRCQGYGQCCFAAPDVFKLRGEEALEYDPAPDETLRVQVLRAAKACPVQAISIGWTGEEAEKATPGASRRKALTTAKTNGGVVIVGASLAGLRAAETLRRDGYGGPLTLIGDEPYRPYDRPPLSKEVLAGRLPVGHTTLAHLADLRAEWRLGVPAARLDLTGRRVRLADGAEVGFERLLIATGARARPWPNPMEAALEGFFLLRDRDDAAGLRRHLVAPPKRALVVGGGVMGCEIAAACREIDLPVTLTERGAAPLLRSLGRTVGDAVASLQQREGVDLRLGVTVVALEGDRAGRVRRASLSDGSTLEVDVVVAALGVLRNAEWLLDSGLAADGRGVICDSYCRVLTAEGGVAEDIFVAGDIARWPHPLYEGRLLAIEHWGNAAAQGEIAAHNLLAAPSDRRAYTSLPAFWSRQFGVNIKCVGLPDVAEEVMATQGAVEEASFAAVYGREGRIVAAVTFNKNRWLPFYQAMVEASGPYPLDLQASDAPNIRQSLPAGFATTA